MKFCIHSTSATSIVMTTLSTECSGKSIRNPLYCFTKSTLMRNLHIYVLVFNCQTSVSCFCVEYAHAHRCHVAIEHVDIWISNDFWIYKQHFQITYVFGCQFWLLACAYGNTYIPFGFGLPLWDSLLEKMCLTHSGLLMPYGDTELCKNWFR